MPIRLKFDILRKLDVGQPLDYPDKPEIDDSVLNDVVNDKYDPRNNALKVTVENEIVPLKVDDEVGKLAESDMDTPLLMVRAWTNEEVDMLQQAVRTFAEDLNVISETIKQRTVAQISNALKKKAFEDNGITANLLQNQQPGQIWRFFSN